MTNLQRLQVSIQAAIDFESQYINSEYQFIRDMAIAKIEAYIAVLNIIKSYGV